MFLHRRNYSSSDWLIAHLSNLGHMNGLIDCSPVQPRPYEWIDWLIAHLSNLGHMNGLIDCSPVQPWPYEWIDWLLTCPTSAIWMDWLIAHLSNLGHMNGLIDCSPVRPWPYEWIDWLLTCPTYLNTLSPRRSCAATTVLRAAERTLLSRSLIWLAITFNAMAGDGWQTLSPQVDMRFPSSSRHSEPHKRTHIRNIIIETFDCQTETSQLTSWTCLWIN